MIKEIRFKNYRQYKSKTITFTGTLSGIVGRNGAGKSNLLKALEYTFTGKVADTNKTALVSWGEKSGEISADIVVDGIVYTITRSLSGNKAEVAYEEAGEKVKITGINDVNAFVGQLTGVDNITTKTVFPHQGDIAGVLFEPGATRQKAWLSLCGLGDSATINTRLGQLINSRLPETIDYTTQIEEAQIYAMALAEESEKLGDALEIAQESASGVDDGIRRGSELLSRVSVLQAQKRDRLLQLERSRIQMEQHAVAVAAAADGLRRALAEKQFDPDSTCIGDGLVKYAAGVVATLQSLEDSEFAQSKSGNDALTALNQCKMVVTAYDAAVVERDRVNKLASEFVAVDHLARIDVLTHEQQLRDERHGAVTYQILTRAKVMELAGHGSVDANHCLFCKQKIDDLAALSVILTREVDDLKKERAALDAERASAIAEISRLESEHNQSRQRQQQLQHQVGLADAGVTRASAGITQLQGSGVDIASIRDDDVFRSLYNTSVANINEVSNRAQEIRRYRTTIQTLTETYNRVNAVTSGNELRHQHDTNALLETTMAWLDVCGDIVLSLNPLAERPNSVSKEYAQDLIARVSENLVANQAERNRLDVSVREYNMVVSRRLTADDSVKSLVAKQAQQESIRAAKTVLGTVRDWFHYEAGPKAITSKLLDVVVDSTNEFLTKFGSRYFVTADLDEMSMRYCYRDGTFTPHPYPMITELSGGEKVMLAVSFRFATHCLFAGKVKLLTLDEPTVFLDDTNIASFVTLLETAKAVSAGMGLQVVMSTHETSVIPALDTVIEVQQPSPA